jgi:hypothetical protein
MARLLATWFPVIGLFVIVSEGRAQCCCSPEPRTIREKANEADVIFLAEVARYVPGKEEEVATEFRIVDVVKRHPLAKGKKSFVHASRVPADDLNHPPRFIIFCEVKDGRFDPYEGIEVETPAIVEYAKKAIALDTKDPARSLPFFFGYLGHKDSTIRQDACRELSKSSHEDLRKAAKSFDPEKLAGWLRDGKLTTRERALYGLLLGYCGKAEHAKLLRKVIDDAEKNTGSAVDGAMAGYVMLEPKEVSEL